MREILTNSLWSIVEVQREKTNLSCICKSLIIRENVNGGLFYLETPCEKRDPLVIICLFRNPVCAGAQPQHEWLHRMHLPF